MKDNDNYNDISESINRKKHQLEESNNLKASLSKNYNELQSIIRYNLWLTDFDKSEISRLGEEIYERNERRLRNKSRQIIFIYKKTDW